MGPRRPAEPNRGERSTTTVPAAASEHEARMEPRQREPQHLRPQPVGLVASREPRRDRLHGAELAAADSRQQHPRSHDTPPGSPRQRSACSPRRAIPNRRPTPPRPTRVLHGPLLLPPVHTHAPPTPRRSRTPNAERRDQPAPRGTALVDLPGLLPERFRNAWPTTLRAAFCCQR